MNDELLKKAKRKKIRVLIIVLVLIIGAATSIYAMVRTEQKASANSKTASEQAGEDAEKAESTSDDQFKVTIRIECNNAIESEVLDARIKENLPANGLILEQEYTAKKGDCVYDVLAAVCRANNIHMESSYNTGYDSYYIEGINYLYEKACKGMSGWVYKVNGKMPDYGVSGYQVKPGDEILFAYTCKSGDV